MSDLGTVSKTLIWVGSRCGAVAFQIERAPQRRIAALFDSLTSPSDLGDFVDSWQASVSGGDFDGKTLDGGKKLIAALNDVEDLSNGLADPALADREAKEKEVAEAIVSLGDGFSDFFGDLETGGFTQSEVELLVGFYIRDVVERASPLALGILHLFGVLEADAASRYAVSRLDVDQLKKLVSEPENALEHSIGWNADGTAANFQEGQAIHALYDILRGVDRLIGTKINPVFMELPGAAPEHQAYLGTKWFDARSELTQYDDSEKEISDPNPRLLIHTDVNIALNHNTTGSAVDDLKIGSDPLKQLTTFDVGSNFEVVVCGHVDGADFNDLVLKLEPPFQLDFYNPDVVKPDLTARFGVLFRSKQAAGTIVLLGKLGSSRLTADSFKAGVAAELKVDSKAFKQDPSASRALESFARADGLHLVLAGDLGFLKFILKDDAEVKMSHLALTWSLTEGLKFDHGKPEFDIPVNFALGPISMPDLRVGLDIPKLALPPGGQSGGSPSLGSLSNVWGQEWKPELSFSGDVGLNFGPAKIDVNGLGFETLIEFGAGNLGLANLQMGFKPPTGIGISIDAGQVSGAGFLNISDGEYTGALSLSIGSLSLQAFGILTTDLPGGQDGWALLLLIYAEFSSVQIGLGFTLNGVGGIVGLQHGIDHKALQDGVRAGVLDHLLFPGKSAVSNSKTIFKSLKTVFPISSGSLVAGVMFKLGWGAPQLIQMKIGIILKFDDVIGASDRKPSLSEIVLLGQFDLTLPPGAAKDDQLVRVLVDIRGVYFVKSKALEIDASLRNSHLGGNPMSGTLAVRANFGGKPNFLLSVGGFHPKFIDIPAGLPDQQRLGIALGDSDGKLTLALKTYTAVSSNSFQFGVEALLHASGSDWELNGHLEFDALFIFKPRFMFEVGLDISLALEALGKSIASVHVALGLSGPKQWHAHGSATAKILGLSFTASFDENWGDPAPPINAGTIDVLAEICDELSQASSWTFSLPGRSKSPITLNGTDQPAIAHPMARGQFLQKVAPLEADVYHVGKHALSSGGVDRFEIEEVSIGGTAFSVDDVLEHFATGDYRPLDKDQKLKEPSFGNYLAGAAFADEAYEMPWASGVECAIEYESKLLGEDDSVVSTHGVSTFLGHGIAGTSALNLDFDPLSGLNASTFKPGAIVRTPTKGHQDLAATASSSKASGGTK